MLEKETRKQRYFKKDYMDYMDYLPRTPVPRSSTTRHIAGGGAVGVWANPRKKFGPLESGVRKWYQDMFIPP